MSNSSFKMRMISGFILGPLILLAVIYGGFAFQICFALVFGLSIKEWMGMTKLSKHTIRDSILGIAYLVICFSALFKLRLDLDQGMFLTLVLVIGVWGSDIGAYFSGKLIGGPKLAEKISPNKTWAGLVGGAFFSGALVGGANYYAAALSFESFMPVVTAFVVGALFTVIGQIGDLLVSGYKRKVGVKDTGNLIPGHGGILDRIDATLLVTPFFLILLMEMAS